MTLPQRVKSLVDRSIQDGLDADSHGTRIKNWVTALDRDEILDLAASALADELRQRRRQQTRQVERRVTEPARPVPTPSRPKSLSDAWKSPGKRTKGYNQWLYSEPSTPEKEYVRNRDRENAEIDRRLREDLTKTMTSALESFKQSLRVEWTQELLDSTFALRDGTSVRWGEATVSQFEERKEMFMTNARANLEGAARVEHAISALRSTGELTLDDVMRKVAV